MKIIPLPFYAYLGRTDYICAVYEKSDYETAFGELEHLHCLKYRIWYDENASEEETDYAAVAKKIDGCKMFIFIVTSNAGASKDVRSAVNYALDIKVPFIAIYAEDAQIPNSLKLGMSYTLSLNKFELSKKDYEQQIANILPGQCIMNRSEQKKYEIAKGESAYPSSVLLKRAYDRLKTSDDARLLAKEGNEEELKKIGEVLDINRVTDAMRSMAEKEFTALAERDDAEAQFELSVLLCVKDRPKALKLLQKSADAGYAPAQVEYGELLMTSPALSHKKLYENLKTATFLFSDASKAGNADGTYRLAECFHLELYENVIKKDIARAAQLYYKAAQEGNEKAKRRLYDKPYIMTQYLKADEMRENAFRLMEAAKKGDNQAQNDIGMCYIKGDGVPIMPELGLKLLLSAGEARNADALYNLGILAYEGEVMDKDMEISKKFLMQAADKGHYMAIRTLEKIEDLNR